MSSKITLHNANNMDIMAQYPEKYFDLLISDPPYGINVAKKGMVGGGDKKFTTTKFKPKYWDKEPSPKEYFEEAIRVSKNQIFWGANHYRDRLPKLGSCEIIWDKLNGSTDFADGEIAYTSFNSAVRIVPFLWNGYLQGYAQNEKEKRIHPTQKPIYLYKWLLNHFAKKGNKILDTHLGSGSIAIACYDLGFDLTGIELDKEYFDAANNRFTQHTRKLTLQFPQHEQTALL